MAAVQILAAEGLVQVRASSGAYVRAISAEGKPASPPLRHDLDGMRVQLSRAKRDVAAVERTLTALLERLPPEEPQ